MIRYPRWRVFFGFLLCPSIAGLGLAVFLLVESVLFQSKSIGSLYAHLGLLFLLTIGPLLFYGVPAALLGVLCSFLGLYKGWRSCVFAFVAGGVFARVWGVIIDTMSRHDEGFPYIPGLDEYTLALLAGFSSFFVSIVVLPQKSE